MLHVVDSYFNLLNNNSMKVRGSSGILHFGMFAKFNLSILFILDILGSWRDALLLVVVAVYLSSVLVVTHGDDFWCP